MSFLDTNLGLGRLLGFMVPNTLYRKFLSEEVGGEGVMLKHTLQEESTNFSFYGET